MIEREYRISAGAARIVVVHDKSDPPPDDRPPHMHVLYSVVDAETGKAIPSQNKFVQNELMARQLEMLLGEPTVPGPNHLAVVKTLRERGQIAEADHLAAFTPAERGQRVGTAMRRQNDRAGLDTKWAAQTAYRVWTESAGDLDAFARGLDDIGFDLLRGDKAVIARHRATSGFVIVRRALNMASKANGAALHLARDAFDDRFGALPSFNDAADAKAEKKLQVARSATDDELLKLAKEALIDGDARQAAVAYKLLAVRRQRAEQTLRRTERELKQQIQIERHRLEKVRRRRVDRAFYAAAIFDTPRMRKVVFAAAATGVLIAGGGLGLALVAGGFAVGALPTREQARAVKRQAMLDQRDAYAREKADRLAKSGEAPTQRMRPTLLRSQQDDGLAGFLLQLALIKKRRRLREDERLMLRAAKEALGRTATAVVEEIARLRSAEAAARSLGLRGPRTDYHRSVLAKTFRSRGQSQIADLLDPITAMCIARAMAAGAAAYGQGEPKRKTPAKMQVSQLEMGRGVGD